MNKLILRDFEGKYYCIPYIFIEHSKATKTINKKRDSLVKLFVSIYFYFICILIMLLVKKLQKVFSPLKGILKGEKHSDDSVETRP